ncbi:MAG: amidohydrolase family protein [Verrucomicrobia bacterium]|nr:amidohydrolase family protein [Verrucomicrobiota bacterium]
MSTTRREFLKATAGLAATVCCAETAAPRPSKIIDTHAHFYDPTRPQGVPWPPKDAALLYRTTLPKNYRALPVPQRVDGTVVVEASTWVEDNQWILDMAARDPFIVGLVGNLPLGTPECAGLLKRFAANPIFRGVRIRDGSFEKLLGERAFINDMRLVAELGLSFDVHFPPSAWVEPSLRLAQLVPNLRLIINHAAGADVTGKAPRAEWQRLMEKLAAHPQVFMKVSGLVEGTKRRKGDAPADVDFYRPVLDILWKLFGAERLVYASNWPVSEYNAPLGRVQQIAMSYFAAKGQEALDKVFWKNARTAYGLKS